MLRLHPKEHTLLGFVGKAEHNHKNNTSKQCVPNGEYGQKKTLSVWRSSEGFRRFWRNRNLSDENGITEGRNINSLLNQPTSQPSNQPQCHFSLNYSGKRDKKPLFYEKRYFFLLKIKKNYNNKSNTATGILENTVTICTISNQKFKESENQSTITMNNKTANIVSIFF